MKTAPLRLLVLPSLWFGLIAAVLPPGPAPSPGPSPSPNNGESVLREIGRVRATTALCRTLLNRTTTAVNAALGNDRKITVLTGTLKTVELDANVLKKFAGERELRHQYVALRAAAVQGEREMKAFREEVKAVKDPEQKAALEKLADAIAGALFRQQKLADDMGRYLAWLAGQEPLDDEKRRAIEHDAMQGQTRPTNPFQGTNGPVPRATNEFGPTSDFPGTLNGSARQAAVQIESQEMLVMQDELDAAKRIDPAFARC